MVLAVLLSALSSSAALSAEPSQNPRSLTDSVKLIIEAVNRKDPDQYVSVFDEAVVIRMHQGSTRIAGRDALRRNRSQHFARFPAAHSEIQHIVEIDAKVVLHDKVWLHGLKTDPANIVEIFTFRNGLIVEVEVIQPEGLLAAPARTER